VAELTPLECFFAGVAFAGTGLAVFLFFAIRSIAKARAEPGTPFHDRKAGLPPTDPSAATVHHRLQELEKRVAELESQVRRRATA
jgi:hypothetical protein